MTELRDQDDLGPAFYKKLPITRYVMEALSMVVSRIESVAADETSQLRQDIYTPLSSGKP